MKTTHTKGEWWWSNPIELDGTPTKEIRVISESALIVDMTRGNIYSGRNISFEEKLANAKLIAAAPELLEALNQMNVALTGHEIEPEQEAAFELMRQAIKKATS